MRHVALVLGLVGIALQTTGCGGGDRPAPSGPHAVGHVPSIPMVDAERDRRFEVFLWYPAEGAAGTVVANGVPSRLGPRPLLVMAHGLGGAPADTAALAEQLASYGYVVAGPKFPGSFDDDMNELLGDIVHHPGDVRLTIDAALGRNELLPVELRGLVDPERIGMFGLSYGGLATYLTTFDHELRDPRIRLAATVAGGAGDLFEPRFYETADRQIPLLLIHGSADALIEFDTVAGTVFRNALAPKYLIRLEGGTHMGFADGVPTLPFLHPDRLACLFFPSIDDDDPETGKAFRHLANRGPDLGVNFDPKAPLPCSYGAESQAWMPPAEQLALTKLALLHFLGSHFGEDPAAREQAHASLLLAFGSSLRSVLAPGR
jgi:predicted dienelactone hydrolase